mmetsp:Transcript_2309/g.4857  ORF Transcript_2309/g.4857 Transcript_2309/m.4857 type:complete len:86 (+) Transcript_2309:1002-1259(+)
MGPSCNRPAMTVEMQARARKGGGAAALQKTSPPPNQGGRRGAGEEACHGKAVATPSDATAKLGRQAARTAESAADVCGPDPGPGV